MWRQFLVHTDAIPTVAYWFDPFDPDSPGTSKSMVMTAKESLAELLEGNFRQEAYGKRCLIEVTLPPAVTPKRVLGMEVYAEATTRRAI